MTLEEKAIKDLNRLFELNAELNIFTNDYNEMIYLAPDEVFVEVEEIENIFNLNEEETKLYNTAYDSVYEVCLCKEY